MRFAYGCTRWVILTDRYAIKIARVRPIRPCIRLLQLLRRREVRQKLEQHDSNLLKAVLKYLAAGIRANRTEYRLYKKYGDDLLTPTLFTVGWLVNIQLRGEPCEKKDVHRHWLWSMLYGTNTPLAKDVLQLKQFCMLHSKVCLADYGNDSLEPILARRKGRTV